MTNGAIETVFFPGFKAIVGPDLVNAGILANKSGYHNSRNRLIASGRTGDYSIQEPIDKLGPGDLGSAIDTTFKTAQGGDYHNIAKYSKLLFDAGVNKDPRTYPLREFYGNTDLDTEVEGYSYFRGRPGSSDKSHLYHIHFSFWRKYINDPSAMESVLSILRGDSPPPPGYPVPKTKDVYLSKLVLNQKDSDSVWHLQTALRALGAQIGATGDLNKATMEAWAQELFDAADYEVILHNDL